jgi:hypothetical protein
MNKEPNIQRMHIRNLAFKVDKANKVVLCKNLKREGNEYHLISKGEIDCLNYISTLNTNKSTKAKEILNIIHGDKNV